MVQIDYSQDTNGLGQDQMTGQSQDGTSQTVSLMGFSANQTREIRFKLPASLLEVLPFTVRSCMVYQACLQSQSQKSEVVSPSDNICVSVPLKTHSVDILYFLSDTNSSLQSYDDETNLNRVVENVSQWRRNTTEGVQNPPPPIKHSSLKIQLTKEQLSGLKCKAGMF